MATASFEAQTDVPPLHEDEIHVWHLALPSAPNHQTVAIAARSALQTLLRGYGGLSCDPRIERGPHGKPYAPEMTELEFNLSHAGNHVLLAFARGQSLGVDLEHGARRISVVQVARRFFAPNETEALLRVPDEQRLHSFLDIWTHKEALLKALGRGLQFGLARVEFTLGCTGEVDKLVHIASEAGVAADWRLARLRPAPGLIGALAWHGPHKEVRAFRLEP